MAMEAPASPTAIDQGELNPRKRLKSDGAEDIIKGEHEEEEEELERLLLPDPNKLPVVPPSAVDSNFVHYFVVDFLKPGHDQYIYRHANGLCVVGLAPTHVALAEEGGITAVDFNTGKTDKSEMKVIGKRKKNAQHLQANSALCKVFANDKLFIVRCCVKGSLLEVNDKLLREPTLLNTAAAREGYVAILMPKPEDWLKSKDSYLNLEEYKKLRGVP
ncbi:uncharacterized protein LOC116260495 isoform X2 [Nymphaea colorata]|uniref:uncharacterized protein LOC116260495 isoform X2 n=1 Tax=Nymphaea colorata TaxID=210225 RepID=UPI00129ED51D|nr:uncharacterized protein LOC116260495 isoform X2 [Nymphaea colorata]